MLTVPVRNEYHHHHHHHHVSSVMELGHLLTRSGLTYPEVFSKVFHDSFCQLGSRYKQTYLCPFHTGPRAGLDLVDEGKGSASTSNLTPITQYFSW